MPLPRVHGQTGTDPTEDLRIERHLLLGEDHGALKQFAVTASADQRAALAISSGWELAAASKRAKGSKDHPNEDAGWLAWGEEHAVAVVADAHHGREASHDLLRAIHERDDLPPTEPAELKRWMAKVIASLPASSARSGAAVLLVVLDRARHEATYWATGDCTAYRITARGRVERVIRRRSGYFHRADGSQLSPRAARLTLRRGDGLLLATDGLFECCYGDASRSVQPEDIEATLAVAPPDAAGTLAAIMKLALTGVRGQPGGQDNVCLALLRP